MMTKEQIALVERLAKKMATHDYSAEARKEEAEEQVNKGKPSFEKKTEQRRPDSFHRK